MSYDFGSLNVEEIRRIDVRFLLPRQPEDSGETIGNMEKALYNALPLLLRDHVEINFSYGKHFEFIRCGLTFRDWEDYNLCEEALKDWIKSRL